MLEHPQRGEVEQLPTLFTLLRKNRFRGYSHTSVLLVLLSQPSATDSGSMYHEEDRM